MPSLYESISPDQMRSQPCFGSPPMYSCNSITVIHSSRPRLPSGAAHFVACAMVSSIFPRDAPARNRVPFRLCDD